MHCKDTKKFMRLQIYKGIAGVSENKGRSSENFGMVSEIFGRFRKVSELLGKVRKSF